MIIIDITKEGKGRHRRFFFEVIYGEDSENYISIRKTPKGGRVKLQAEVEDSIDPTILASMFRVSSIICTLISLHLDFVQIHKALQSIEGVQVNDIRFEDVK